jgi:Trk K+ transport system NAD-binding subunit
LELLEEAGVDKAKLVVSTITDHATNLVLVEQVARLNKRAILICQSDTPKDASVLYKKGATYVIMPHFIGSEQISTFIKRSELKKGDFTKPRERHIKNLREHTEQYK